MIIKNQVKILLMVGFVALTMSGCTGMKAQSFPAVYEVDSQYHRVFHLKTPLPTHQSLSICPFQYHNPDMPTENLKSGQKVGLHFAEQLKIKLEKTGRFSTIEVISDSQECQTDLILEGEIVSHTSGPGDWFARVMIPAPNLLVLQGRMTDRRNDKELLQFCLGRAAQGGALGVGGLLSAGGTTMGKKISEWIADDMIVLMDDVD